MNILLEPILRVSVKIDKIWEFLNIDLGGKGDFVAQIKNVKYSLVGIVVRIWSDIGETSILKPWKWSKIMPKNLENEPKIVGKNLENLENKKNQSVYTLQHHE